MAMPILMLPVKVTSGGKLCIAGVAGGQTAGTGKSTPAPLANVQVKAITGRVCVRIIG